MLHSGEILFIEAIKRKPIHSRKKPQDVLSFPNLLLNLQANSKEPVTMNGFVDV